MHVNVQGYIDFLSATEADGFELYFSLVEQYHASPDSKPEFCEAPTGGKLTGGLSEQMRTARDVLWQCRSDGMPDGVFENGWVIAESTVGGVSATATLLNGFQA